MLLDEECIDIFWIYALVHVKIGTCSCPGVFPKYNFSWSFYLQKYFLNKVDGPCGGGGASRILYGIILLQNICTG